TLSSLICVIIIREEKGWGGIMATEGAFEEKGFITHASLVGEAWRHPEGGTLDCFTSLAMTSKC
ncbi:MAG: hypothetical protein LBQ39_01075, partial [Tannerellaceae bacterium]|nr:hypothetical protein [Tannerellaceae bacterium]